MSRRIRWLGIFMLLCFGILFLQLNYIQVVKAHQYATAPGNPTALAEARDQPRGIIASSDGVILADSVPAPRGSAFKYQRQYPTGSLFGQITGMFSYYYGEYGVESSYDSYLVVHNRPIRSLGDLLTTSTVTDTVTLTLSDKLQTLAQSLIGTRDGSVVAIDPRTGGILAMYSNPSFDPTPLASQSSSVAAAAWKADTATPDHLGNEPFTSLAYQDIAFPGSTFKIVTTSAAYEHAPQLIGTPMKFYTCIPPKTFGGQTTKLCNYANGGCGGTIAQMLPPSCDTGYALLGTMIGAPGMLQEADAYGFNSKVPIDIPTSAYSQSQFLQPSCYQNAEIFLAFSAIGQDCTKATPLQMAMVAATIANNGVEMTPHVMASIRDSQGNLVMKYVPKVWSTPVSASTAAAVNGLMVGVTHDANGTAAGVFPASEDVAAKTGTAQVQNTAGVYIATNDWMIAFAPASAPKVAVAVELLDQPVSDTGAQQAGPVLAQMLAAILGASTASKP
ncbi:MAG: peptidoglycan D,D-transpeptidase FtsI family protein [Acidimicrobiales bacterium]